MATRNDSWWIASTGIAYLAVVVVFIPFFILSTLVWLLTSWCDRKLVIYHMVLSLWCLLFIGLNPFWSLRVEGRSHLPKGACLLACNHQSMVDILMLFTLFYPFKWVAKQELFSVPLIGWILRMGRNVPIARGRAASAQQMMTRCQEVLRGGLPVLIFPEGSRSKTGQVGHFHHGVGRMALAAGVPIVPIALNGSLQTRYRAGIRWQRVPLVVHILPPMPHPAQEDEVPTVVSQLEATIRQEVETIQGH